MPVEDNPFPTLDLPLAIRATLARRGFNSFSQVEEILTPISPSNPQKHFPELKKAIEVLTEACASNEKIAICGDYDADGITSTALLFNTLNELGGDPITCIPSRMDEGYGLNQNMINELNNQEIKIIVTVDNGISAIEALDLAKHYQMKVIITDHHTMPNIRPSAVAIVHPETTPKDSEFRTLAGVGLAYVLACELAYEMNNMEAVNTARDLFCIGTIADMAPLTGANRAWVKEGLKSFYKSKCKGIIALKHLSGLLDDTITAEEIGFKIAPRINAVGRIGEPKLVVDLLTINDLGKAMSLAQECEIKNRQRKELCEGIEAEALALIESDTNNIPPFILLAQSHWHHGVIGIVAARIMERFNRPTAILGADKKGRFRASLRSPEGFSISNALKHCSKYLITYGGHHAAGGFTILPNYISGLHNELNKIADIWMKSQNVTCKIKPDALLRLADINESFWNQLQKLEPFGIGNPKPIFWSRNCEIINYKSLKGQHSKFTFSQGGHSCEGIFWNFQGEGLSSNNVDIAYQISLNKWNEQVKLQLNVLSLRPYKKDVSIKLKDREYICSLDNQNSIILINSEGVKKVIPITCLNNSSQNEDLIDNPYMITLIKNAKIALGVDV